MCTHPVAKVITSPLCYAGDHVRDVQTIARPPPNSSMVYAEGRCKVVYLSGVDAEGVLTWIKTLEPYTSMLAMWTIARDTVQAQIRDLTRNKRRYEANQ
jgi:hypothetical protein